MKVFYYNGQHVRIQTGNKTIAYNPPSKESSLLVKTKKPADLVISSINHPDFNGIQNTLAQDGFWANTPGEYELDEIFIHGVPSHSAYENKTHLGQDKLINTIYTITAEGINMVFLGALKSKEDMNYEAIEDIESVDIVFVPIGGGEVLTPQEAYSLANSLEAKMVVPVHFSGIGSESSLGEFLKEAGREGLSSVDKLTVKKKDLTDLKAEVVVIQS